ncbi:TetR family transcriptional regulator [Nocardia tenerifensis]|uniref:TetR family transcriptional regulator n=1 Tax=Nocardia tenerifensis TaxID=228006 RepID=A0A318KD31_9NOCA|nr:TetR/AcrR family transcriptional regulator [Nocardia tenerifensis]PXX70659.1 TetR family transcriptional regulator [Nocardia tenerifensis]
MTNRTTPPVRRQERGRRRITEILDNAETLFAERGFEATTTNAIAERAGISPGSLYQFFRSKEEIVHSLAERYVTELETAQAAALALPPAHETLPQFIHRAVGNMVAFNIANPGFQALFARTDMKPALQSAITPLQRALEAGTYAALSMFARDKSDHDIAVYTQVTLQITRGLMPVIAASDPPRRRRLTDELETALVAYLTHTLAATEPNRP